MGSQSAFAKAASVDRATVCKILQGLKQLQPKIFERSIEAVPLEVGDFPKTACRGAIGGQEVGPLPQGLRDSIVVHSWKEVAPALGRHVEGGPKAGQQDRRRDGAVLEQEG